MVQIAYKALRFERFVLDLTRGSLRMGDVDIELSPKAFKVLCHLAQNAGRLVPKEELYEAVWPNVYVSNDSLVQCIRELRRKLGDDERSLIKTLSRRGYLLDVRISPVGVPELWDPRVTTGSAMPERATSRDPHLAPLDDSHPEVFEGGRKHITVLYADIKEGLELCAQHDPEEALQIFEAVLKLMKEAVRRFGGTVILEMADGIMALFGVPVTQEDHAIRACRAALQIQEAMKHYAHERQDAASAFLMARAGLSSGEVVVRSIASGPHSQYRAMGKTTHVATRLGRVARAGTSLISAETLRLAEGHIVGKMLQGASFKPLGEPVYELVGAGPVQSRFQVLAARGLTRFVGREAELQQLARVQQMAAKGRGQVVAVVGEAGIGKSRCVYEFTDSHRLHGWLVLQSAAFAYGTATSYLPVIDLLKGYFKIQDRDDHSRIREKVAGKLPTVDEVMKPTEPALLSLLDVPVDDAAWKVLDPTQRRQRTFDAVKRLLLREARKQPLLIIIEDLHWIDNETQALLDVLVDSLGSARVLFLANYRPEYQHTWGSKTYYSQLRLDVLPAESAVELLEVLLGKDAGLAPLKKLLVKRANPFFIEETVRSLVETEALVGERGRYRLMQPIKAVRVPPTVQVILAARIDRLAPDDRRLLQVASVVGKDVPFSLLQAIADLSDAALRCGLKRLQSAEFLYETGLLPDLEYTFKHALSQEIAYEGLLVERRRELHARTVAAIEALYRDRRAEQFERLAYHAVRGDLREKAVHYLQRAGIKTAARSALQDARVWFEQALSILETLPKEQSTLGQALQIRLELHFLLVNFGEVRSALEHLRAAELITERMNDDKRRAQICASMTLTHAQLGELDEALEAGSRALEIDRQLGGKSGFCGAARTYLVYTHYLRGEYEQAVELAGNLPALPADWGSKDYTRPSTVFARSYRLGSLIELGRFAEATECEAEMMRIVAPIQHAHSIGIAYLATSALHLVRGDWITANLLIEKGIVKFRTANIIVHLRNSFASSAWILAQLGRESEALNRIEEGQELIAYLAARGYGGNRGRAYYSLGRACLLVGRLDEAQQLGVRAVEASRSQFGFKAHALHLLGDIATHPDRLSAESAETHYRQALALAEPRGMRPLVAHCHLGLCNLYRRMGNRQEGRSHLGTATAMYREMEMRFWLEQVGEQINELN